MILEKATKTSMATIICEPSDEEPIREVVRKLLGVTEFPEGIILKPTKRSSPSGMEVSETQPPARVSVVK